MANLQSATKRIYSFDGINNCIIVNDVDSSGLQSLSAGLALILQQKRHTKQTLILSDIPEAEAELGMLYKKVADLIGQHAIDRLIGIGPEIAANSALFDVSEQHFYNSSSQFIDDFSNLDFENETVLLSGARHFNFQQISAKLQLLAHAAVLEVDLAAAMENLDYFRSHVQPETKLMAMVKAFGYGSGSYEVAKALERKKVDYLAVAYADEGVELRKAGISVPIMVMNIEQNSCNAVIEHNLQPEIYSFKVLREFTEALNQSSHKGSFPIHIKIDTGMRRLGFDADDISDVIDFIADHPELKIESIFSHLTSTDIPDHDDFTRKQVNDFDRISNRICASLDYPTLRHILNSNGILRFPEAQFDMARLGIGLYGVAYNDEAQSHLKTVATLKTIISQIRTVKAGNAIGYSRKGEAKQDMQVATLAIGYADGLNRRLGNGKGNVRINGKSAPIVGNVCMDMIMVDITGIDASEGDSAVIFGDEITVQDIAKTLNTIPYEILTSISRRVKRVYYW